MGKRIIFSRKSTITLIGAAVLCLCAICSVILTNALGLRKAIDQRVQSYLQDVSVQSTQVADSRIHTIYSNLHTIADSLAVLSDEERDSFISRSHYYTDNFDEIILIRADGASESSSGSKKDFSSNPAFEKAMAGEFSADVHDDYVIYMYPVSENGKEVSIIAGKKSKAQMEQLLSVGLFDDQGSFTIVDRNGDIVFRPDRKDFLHLINETDYDDSADWAVQIINDFRDGRQGSVSLPTTSGQTILLDYRPLSHFGWQTVNMVPENFISSEVDVFVNRMFIIILVLTTVFLALLLIIILMQARYSTKLEAAAFIDRITDGPSIIRFQMLARRMVSQAAPCSRAVAVLNIRRFKFINDLYGSKYGNRMLRDIYWAILEQTDPDDELVARGESDHYYMLLQYSSEDQLAERLSSLSDFLRKRFCGELDILLHFNIGVYLVDPADQPDIISFQDRANLARASADNSFSDSCIFYNEDFSLREKKELQLFQVITEALQNREFLMVLQPKIDLRDDSICGAEALARWNRPGEGMLSPAAFIPVMEKNGILPELDLCIFEQVCAVIRRWLDEGKTPVPISVNLSRQQLRARHFLRRYLEILHRHAVPADLIEFEITESTMFTDAEISEVKGLIEEIHNCGFRCSLDDFGSEYSALGLISEFPIDRIKLDRSFFHMTSATRGHKQSSKASFHSPKNYPLIQWPKVWSTKRRSTC